MDATKDEIPRLGSACTVNRVIVREDLIAEWTPLWVGCLLLLDKRGGFSNGQDVFLLGHP
jgi:hypothetical protein